MTKNSSILVLSLALLLATPAAGGAQKAAAPPQLFATSDQCMACHNGMTTHDGLDISIGFDWRSSMMAHAARDPYWQGAVRRETLDHPSASAAIQNECSACHMPMSRYTAKITGQMGQVFAHLPIAAPGPGGVAPAAANPASVLAADGVSCSMCHQIQPDHFGQKESFTAGFVVDTKTRFGSRSIFGPFQVDPGRTALMHSASQFNPAEGTHVQQSELCATCHTLYTHALGADGEVVGELPEQVPYLEWRHSSYKDAQSCQSCHMPVVEGEAPIAGVMGQPRAAVSRHVFRGGNFFMPKILNRYRTELGVVALPQELAATSSRTVEHLGTSAAVLTLERTEVSGGRLTAHLLVESLAGHKLPTAYPSRRAWLHVTVLDDRGQTVFESGAIQPDGAIAGNDNDADPSRYEPHYAAIERPDQVQIYEPILVGPDDGVTTGLLTAVRYVKDNRVLPLGFDKATAEEDIAVRGKAFDDPDFTAGEDRIRYTVDLGGATGPFTVQAELLYQPIAYRWAHNLAQQQAMETDRFVGYYDSLASASWATLARAEARVE